MSDHTLQTPLRPPSSNPPTLRALLGNVELRLRLDGTPAALEPGALDQALRWVHSSDLADPTPFLSEGLLLLTTGTQFTSESDDSPAFRDYVRRLTQCGVVGLGFGTDVVRAELPEPLIVACRAEGMPLFEVPYRTPFIAVARANAEAIAAEAYSRRSWALAAQRAISLAALRPDGLGATFAELARQLGGWVGLFDTTGNLVREHPTGALTLIAHGELHREVERVLRRGVRAGSSVQTGSQSFSLQTLGRNGHVRGVIAIAADDALDDAGRGVVTSVIALAGLAMEQQHDLTHARGLLRGGVLESLLRDDDTLGQRIAAQIWGGLPEAPLVIVAADTPPGRGDAMTQFLELRAAQAPGRLFFAEHDGGFVLCVQESDVPLLDSLVETFDVHLGVSGLADYPGFSHGHRQSTVALARARERREPIVHFSESAHDGVLGLVNSDDARIVARSVLGPLIDHDAEHGTQLVTTLRTWLEADAGVDAAARMLGVHRHTVRARIALAQKLFDRDLTGFSARADLWVALNAL